MKTVTHTITEILEEGKKSLKVKTDKLPDGFLWVKKSHVKDGKFEKDEPVELDKFWQDVDSLTGMEVCTPFIERFAGHSFVAYDKGFVWSKTLKAIFKLREFSGSKAYYPKAYEKVYSFGSDLSELENN
jgi:hypothetical protein